MSEGSEQDYIQLNEIESVDFLDGEDPVRIVYPLEEGSDQIPPVLLISVSYNEDEDLYYITDEYINLLAISETISTGINEIRKYRIDNYHHTTYSIVERYTSDGDIHSILLNKNDTVLFTVGETDDLYNSSESQDVSFEFWSGLVEAETQLSNELETINNVTVGAEGYRIPVKETLSDSERSLIVHISKYMIEFYKENYVLSDDVLLHQLYTYANILTGSANFNFSKRLVYSEV